MVMTKVLSEKQSISASSPSFHFQGEGATIVPSFSVLEDVRYLKTSTTSYDSKDPEESLFCLSDVYLLLNSERIRQFLGDDTYRYIIDAMSSSVKSASNKVSLDVSDSDRLSLVKSRYVQSPAEMRAYMIDLDNRFGALKAKLEEEISSQPSDSVIDTDPVVTPSGNSTQMTT